MRTSAKKGRFFPLGEADIIALLREHSLFDEDGDLIGVEYANPKREFSTRHAVLELRPRSRITFYSSGEDTPREAAIATLQKAVAISKDLNQRPLPVRGNSDATVVIYREKLGCLRVVERRTFYQQRKYRGDAKFSNAFRARKIRVEEKDRNPAT